MSSKDKDVKVGVKVEDVKVERVMVYGLDITDLPMSVQVSIRKAAEDAAKRATEKAVKVEKDNAILNRQRKAITEKMVNALDDKDKAYLKEHDIRRIIVFRNEDGTFQDYPVFSSNAKGKASTSKGNGTRAVKVNGVDYANSTAACVSLGLEVGKNSAYRVLVQKYGEAGVTRAS